MISAFFIFLVLLLIDYWFGFFYLAISYGIISLIWRSKAIPILALYMVFVALSFLYPKIVVSDVSLKDVKGISKYALSQEGNLYEIEKVKKKGFFSSKYTFYIYPKNRDKFQLDRYIIEGSGEHFNNLVYEFEYIRYRSSVVGVVSDSVWENVKGFWGGIYNSIRHPIETAKGFYQLPKALAEEVKDFYHDPDIIKKIRVSYNTALTKKAEANSIDFDLINLDETRKHLKFELDTEIATKSAIEAAGILLPIGYGAKGVTLSRALAKTASRGAVGGSSRILAKRLLIESGDWSAHHIIPVELKNHKVLNKIGMDMDEVENGIALPNKPGLDPDLPLHRGSHPSYTEAIKKELDEIPENWSVAKTQKAVRKIQEKYRHKLEEGTPLHEKYGASDPWD